MMPDEVTYTYYVHTEETPPLYYRVGNPDIGSTLEGYFSDPLNLVNYQLEDNFLYTAESFEKMKKEAATTARRTGEDEDKLLRKILLKNTREKVLFVSDNDEAINSGKKRKIRTGRAGIPYTVTLTAVIPEENGAAFERYVESVMAQLEESTRTRFEEQLDRLFEKNSASLGQLSDSAASTSSAVGDTQQTGTLGTESFASLTDTLNEINVLRSTGYKFMYLDKTVMEVAVSKGRVKKSIISVFAAFAVFVFAAYARNALENIKAAPDVTGKIQQAWDEGKKSKKQKS